MLRPAALLSLTIMIVACSRSHESSEPTTASAYTPPVDSSALAAADEKLEDSVTVLGKIGDSLPAAVAKRTRCVAIVPNMIKGGLIVGARHGTGFATCRNEPGWSAPAPISVSGGSVGALVGVESVDLVMVVVTDEGKEQAPALEAHPRRRRFSGRRPREPAKETATNDDDLRADVLSILVVKGLFAGAELKGAVLEPDKDTTGTLFGSQPDMRAILSR